jgi:hypothetical protein
MFLSSFKQDRARMLQRTYRMIDSLFSNSFPVVSVCFPVHLARCPVISGRQSERQSRTNHSPMAEMQLPHSPNRKGPVSIFERNFHWHHRIASFEKPVYPTTLLHRSSSIIIIIEIIIILIITLLESLHQLSFVGSRLFTKDNLGRSH